MQTLTKQNAALSDKDFREIRKIVYDHCGINLNEGKKELVYTRLSKRLRVGGFTTFPEYMKHVLEDKTGVEFSMLIDSLSTNLTSFFRESQHFEYLKNVFLPTLMEKKRKVRNSKIRAWSAGCSSGEEPYSLAIVLQEAIQNQGQWDVKILATDISTRMVEAAKLGVYSPERVKPVPAAARKQYLVERQLKGQKVFEANASLKNILFFRYLNLMESWPFKGPMDFIFCRNVMIYFDKPTQARLVNRYWDLLAPGGILFTGHSESLTGIEHKFEYIQPTIYLKA